MSRLSRDTQSKLHTYFIKTIGATDYNHGWLKSDCPHCGKPQKFGINLSQNRTNCFVCGEKLSPINLLMMLEGFQTFSEATHFLNTGDFYDLSYKETTVPLKTSESSINLPEHFVLFGTRDNSYVGKAARATLIKRGFNIDEVRKLGWGYCNDGEYLGYMIIPFINDNRLVYFNARRILGSGPRYNNPRNEDDEIGKSYIIYNEDALYLYKKVYLCEGAINATTMGEQGISSGGKDISKYQINKILQSPVERVVIMFDSEWFAKLKAIELALQLIPMKKVKVVFFPPEKDVNDIGRKKSKILARETPYMNYNDLIKLKNRVDNEKNTLNPY